MLWTGVICGVLVWALVAAVRCVFRVEEGHLAVLTSFGAPVRDPAVPERVRVFAPGLRFKMPWHRVHKVSAMEQSIDLSHTREGLRTMAADGMALQFDANLRFEADREHLDRFLFALEAPMPHVTGVFTCLLRNEIANVGAAGTEDSYGLIRRERGNISARIRKAIEEDITARYGVRFSAVDLTDVLPPEELADALNAVMNARAEADAATAMAEAESQRRVLASERGVEVARANALASEREVEGIAKVLAQLHEAGTLTHYVARRRAEVLARARAVFLRSDA